ncbi:uncharacterized protein TRIVIDRAFT_228471 [Trichoderma virens Gv29-8]|uniref:Uncharacterized protein n=1 Tax=Hypocrea virens (strain Gv29-8 / FGSC 10586) TaxID=413071 RepID=G9NCL5_HYPVG|nr:uncharacterized protein TRIVIDRAFT_228471 [Trichoderma virens Gv29-8]EHK15437.1 hypothetical protein TRIVIDRAFT_228471 [Trichoderma virens Gv29-8]UKZ51381.1 hypothetical protein TrVGV298_005140 [Trichoderma virens]
MAAQRAVKIEITATDTRFYIRYIGEDPNFHRACTALHYDEIEWNYNQLYRRESDDTISVHFPGYRPEVKHSEGSYQVSLLPNFREEILPIFRFPAALLEKESGEILGLSIPDSYTYQEWRQAVTSPPPAMESSLQEVYPYNPSTSITRPVFNTEPPTRFKSAFARLMTTMHALAAAFSSKWGRIFKRKSKIKSDQGSAHAGIETTMDALEQGDR